MKLSFSLTAGRAAGLAAIRAAGLACGLALAVAPGVAWAQGVSPSRTAETLFREGRQLMDAKDYAAACPKLADSQRLEPAPGTLLNLADCYEKNGQTASAWATFKEAAKSAAARSRADWASTATLRAAALEPKLATLALTVAPASDLADLRIERDGAVVERSTWATPVPVDPGSHTLAATASGHKPWHRVLEVPPTKNLLIDVPVLASDVATPPVVIEKHLDPELAPHADEGRPMRIAGYVAMGVGAVGFAIGTITGVAALGDKSDAMGLCESYPTRCSVEGSATNDDAKKNATISTVSLIAGGALVVGGLVLVLVAPKTSAQRTALLADTVRPFVLGTRF